MTARLPLAATLGPGDASEESPNQRLAGLLLELARCVDPTVVATLPPRPAIDPRLEAMRDMLLEREQVALARLQRKFDDPKEFADAVGAVLPAAFELAAQDARLGQVLAPTVERATQASIRKNPETMVDILYPVMGPAIRKAIAETLEGKLQSLNQALKHSLSWRGLKWRLEAWRSGSAFADVVLRHTAVFRVEHLFLVHRKTGLLLAHEAAEDATTRDPQLVSAMLSAIQDFVRDSFDESAEGGAKGRSIDSLRLGDLLLWCEEGPSAFLAAVIHGNPPPALRECLGETLAAIHEEWRSALDEFDGDTAPFEESAQQRLRPTLWSQSAESKRKLSPFLWAVPVALLLALGGWIGQRVIESQRVDDYVAALRDQPGIVVMGADRHDGKWWVSGLRDPLATRPEALLEPAKLDPGLIVGRWEPYQALHPAIMLKRLQATLNPPPTVSLSQDADGIRADGSAPQHWMDKARAYVQSLPAGAPPVDLSALKDVQDPNYIRLRDALQAHVIPFENNAPRPTAEQGIELDTVATELRELVRVARGLGFSVRVTIVGHADATGKDTANLALSLGRAEVVRSMLRARGIDPNLLSVRGAGPLEPLRPGASADELSINRRVSFVVGTSD
ncbi:Outer membrane protein ArfA [Variovorax sp. PBS-H4]|uniref:OmpA family protein n=1 Tax=Variovorax sp. PBS-H4 TaxID=434008 RepID=UPI001317C284|nr:OmpA family protein [Variovorax sp. PBS-H4]VTU23542.1 Outer membrane protein ArfA [Variovorax sp. PBS-H4]